MTIHRLVTTVLALCALSSVSLFAAGPGEGGREEFEAKLGYQHGTVALKGGLATLRLPDSVRFLPPEGSRRLLVEGWGNPPESATEVLGMIVPAGVSPLTPSGWAVVITYEENGYVNDADAASLNFTKLLGEMKESVTAVNEERQKRGFEPLTLIGWAEPPHYDAASHKLYWAKELAFGPKSEHTLNYNIRILGRRGVLVLNAVASMTLLGAVHEQTPEILAAVDFNEGHRYTDYLPGKDKAATYGIAGLIVGATAAKAGLFKLLWVGILAFKKIIVVGIIALVSVLKRLFRRQPADEVSSTSEQV